MPSVNLVGSYGVTYDPVPGIYDDTTTGTIGVRVSVPLYQAGSVKAGVDRLKSVRDQRAQEIEQVERSVKQAIVSNLYGYEAGVSQIASRVKQVEANQIALEGVYAEMEAGTRTILDTLDAEQELLDAQSSLITAKRNKMVFDLALAANVGLLLPENIGIEAEVGGVFSAIKAIQIEAK